jgi:hypothetical protein
MIFSPLKGGSHGSRWFLVVRDSSQYVPWRSGLLLLLVTGCYYRFPANPCDIELIWEGNELQGREGVKKINGVTPSNHELDKMDYRA